MKAESRERGIIVVTLDNDLAGRIEALCRKGRIRVHIEPHIDRVPERLESGSYSVLLITSAALAAGETDEVEMLDVITARSPATQVLFLAPPRDIRTAMSLIKVGVYQYAKLPVSDEELRLLIEAAMERSAELLTPPIVKQPRRKSGLRDLIGKSKPMQTVYRLIRQAAVTDIPVLLTGETGTGKDLAARAIHDLSLRRNGPFIPVNLGALPRELVASELFGHTRGAFTGAVSNRKGRFEEAHDGSIFLDEISSIEEKVQVSLLRLVETKEFRRLAGKQAVSTNARLIVATNENLIEAVARGSFREDLYYRLNVFRIDLPPLRSREGDIRLLIDEFLNRYSRALGRSVSSLSPHCSALLEDYNWPGNVRELKNVIQRAVLVCQGRAIQPEHLPQRFRLDLRAHPQVTFDVGVPLSEVEREMIIRTLATVGGNKKRAAELLGIGRRTLYAKLAKYGIGH